MAVKMVGAIHIPARQGESALSTRLVTLCGLAFTTFQSGCGIGSIRAGGLTLRANEKRTGAIDLFQKQQRTSLLHACIQV